HESGRRHDGDQRSPTLRAHAGKATPHVSHERRGGGGRLRGKSAQSGATRVTLSELPSKSGARGRRPRGETKWSTMDPGSMRLARTAWSILALGVLAAVAAAGAWAGLAPRKAIAPADQAAARKVLLAASDLPPGWKLQPASTDKTEPPTPKCGQVSFSDLT